MGRRKITAVLVMLLITAACTESSPDEDSTSSPSATASGGTLRVAMISDFLSLLDPAKSRESAASEVFRCCLTRTLLSYDGVPGDEGNALRPDLASDLPVVSDDGLSWTFTLKSGITYAPPFDDVEVTSADMVRALERAAHPKASTSGVSAYLSVIEGFDRFAGGKADSIAGVSAPDPTTLEVTLTRPAGELGNYFALPITAPIPPLDDAPLGAAEGHDRAYGRFLVSTGPYMIEGADAIDVTVPAADREPASGYVPGRSLVLVRSPSWGAATDDLRLASADRIEFVFGGDLDDLHLQVANGDLDLVFDISAPATVIRDYATDPALQPLLHTNTTDTVSFLEINVARPPFDDVHVRRAVNLAIDKDGLRRFQGGEAKGALTGHIVPDSLLGGLLEGFDPYATTDSSGDVEAAREQMAMSAYGDADGMCADPVCEQVLAIGLNQPEFERQAALIEQNLEQIGIDLEVRSLSGSTVFAKCADPVAKVGMCLPLAWGAEYPDASAVLPPLFSSAGILPACCNDVLVGASPEQLQEWGYETTSVPSVDDDLEQCATAVGDERTACWADLDRTLMEDVVPFVPWLIQNWSTATSDAVTAYSFAQSTAHPALDRISVSASG